MIYSHDKIINDISHKKYWYFGNHSKDFVKMCYTTKIISEMNEIPSEGYTQQEIYEKLVKKHNAENPNILIEAAMFKSNISAKIYGLLDPIKRDYTKGLVTEVYSEIENRTMGNFTEVSKYNDIIEQQIEKMYYITELFRTKGKEEFNLYPLFLLYKVLIEIGKRSKEHKISYDEFRYIVALARTYEDWSDIVETILFYRDNTVKFESIISETNPDQRYYQFLVYINLLCLDSGERKKPTFIKVSNFDSVRIIESKLQVFEVYNKIKSKQPGAFPNGFTDFQEYIKFLGENIQLLPTL